MNVVERGTARGPQTPAEAPQPPPAAAAEPAPPARRVKLRPLAALAPYVLRYRLRAGAALLALLAAALATLAVPIAVRRMVDFGFSHEGVELIDSYFSVM